MKLRLFYFLIALFLVSGARANGQNFINIQECILQPAKAQKDKPDLEQYVLRLKLRCSLTSQEVAFLKVAVDSKKEKDFQTVAEKRLWKGKGIPLELEIPINDWKAEKLNVFLWMHGKNPKPDDAPLANSTRIVERASIKSK